MSWPITDLKGISLPPGFTLEEDGPDFLVLLFNGAKVATFSSFGATPGEVEKEINRAAQDRLFSAERQGRGS